MKHMEASNGMQAILDANGIKGSKSAVDSLVSEIKFCPFTRSACCMGECMMWRDLKRDTNPPHGKWVYFMGCALAR